MFGKTEFALYFISALALVGAVCDLFWNRVFNWLTVPAVLAGLVLGAAVGGVSGALVSCGGILAGLALFGWMFPLGVMGGGDVKLLMALGAWGGARFALTTALLSILLGGVGAFAILLVKGRLGDFFRRMGSFFRSVVVPELSVEKPKIDSKLRMPFAVPIGIAAIWVAWADPLVRWGI